MDKRAHVVISGRVQGVFFRASTVEEARRLGLRGWVRNLVDGRVEALIDGDAAAVDRMIEWCRQGPALARVDEVHVSWESPGAELSGFRVYY